MLFTILLGIFIGPIILARFYKPFRYYCFSFVLPQLYDNPKIAKFLGIRFEKDTEWKTNRRDSKVYIPGIIAQLLRWFIGMDFVLDVDTRHKFQKSQIEHKNDINMQPYFDQLEGKTLDVEEFEDFLSEIVVKEINRVYKIIDEEQEKYLLEHVKALRIIVSSLTISAFDGVKTAIIKFPHVIRLSLLLRRAPKETRIMLIAPLLALIHNFIKMIINQKGDMKDVEPYHFLEPVSRFFVAETLCDDGTTDLVFVIRDFDKRNTRNNLAFGPRGLQCPGQLFTFDFIRDVTKFLKNLKIDITGEPQYTKGSARFKNIINKKELKMTFHKINEIAPEIDCDQEEDDSSLDELD